MSKAKKNTSKKATPGVKKTSNASKEPTQEKQPNTGQRRGPGAKRVGGLDAAVQVLGQTGEPMNCKQIVEKMIADKLWQSTGKTPAATISAAITREIAAKGEAARFRKVAPGRFTLNK